MTKFELKYLNELCEINIGKTPARAEADYWGGDNKWLSIADIKNKYLKTTKETITEFAVEKCNMKLIPKNTVVMSFKLSLGKMAILKEDMYSNEAIASFPILKPDTVLPEYLYYALKTVKLEEYADKAAKGITLNKKKLNQIKIPYTNIRNQKKIVAIINVAEDLVSKRQSQITALDELTQSLFLEMFGDPLNGNRWGDGNLENFILKITDGEHNNPQFLSNGEYMIKAKDVLDKGVSFENPSYISKEDLQKFRKKCNPDIGDILLVSRGATIGRTSIVDTNIPFALMGSVILIKLNKDVLNEYYLVHYLKNPFIKSKLLKASSATAQQAIYLKDLKKLKINVPPVAYQKEYEKKVIDIERQKAMLNSSLEQFKVLYNSLLQKAFKGELFQEQ